MKLIATTTALIAATAFSAAAMTSDAIVKAEVKGMGFDSATANALSAEQLEEIAGVLYNGSDADARQAVRGLINKFEG